MTRTLYYGDNLEVLRKHIPDDSVDLIYLDPPFNSNRDYNLLFREATGEPAQAQIKAFTDTWQWSERAYQTFLLECPRQPLVRLVEGFVDTLGRNDLTAYLVMMAPRLIELHRVLKPTGSLYLHCDPTASHYLKVMLDVIFGARNFRNEVVWKRDPAGKGGKRGSRQWPRDIDIILFYTKTDLYTFHQQYAPLTAEQRQAYRYEDERGRYKAVQRGNYSDTMWEKFRAEGRIHRSSTGKEYLKYYLDEAQATIGSMWNDILGFGTRTAAKELLGYPTQKPLALLERIIQASSNEGDVVLDPFCGCGTAIVAAEKLRRQWIGIDITHLAIALIKYRLSDMFGLQERKDYQVIGEPTTEAEARALAQQDRDEFQKWAIGLIPRARPFQEKKGADTGIDGILRFQDDPKQVKLAVIQVKSGKVSVDHIRDFRGVIDREGATLGLFLTLEPPTKPMLHEAGAAGVYITPLGNLPIPRLQIRTVAQLLAGEGFQIPSTALLMGVAQAQRIERDTGQQEMVME
ncbi:MAG: DNA methyltransferase [Armatimonadota bacterium]|nr:DNA methyltransferase [Armatimonadota bacterium]